MHDSRLITILRHIDKKEYRKINDLVRSPYFNKNKDVEQLFKYLRKLAPEFKPEKLIKEDVFKKAFPDKKTTPARQNKLMFTLCKLIETHLAIDYVDRQPQFRAKFLFEQYTTMGIGDYAVKILNDAAHFFRNQPESIEKYALINHYNITINHLKSFSYAEEDIHIVQTSISNIDKLYMLQKMQYEITLITLKEKYNIEIEQSGINDLLKMYGDKQHNSPLLDIFVAIVQAFKSPLSLTAYHRLKRDVLVNIDSFQPLEQNYCFRWLATFFTYVTRAIKSNRDELNREYLDLYKKGFQEKYLLYTKISATVFLNPFMVAGIVGDIEWCEHMMDNYLDCLHASDRPHVDFFTTVYLNFILGNDEKVVEIMHNKTLLYHKNSSLQLLKFYQLLSLFRLKRFDELYDTIKATRVFLYRQKDMNIDYRQHHIEGLKEYEYFFKIHEDKNKLKELLEKIKTSQIPKHWLQKEIEKVLAGI